MHLFIGADTFVIWQWMYDNIAILENKLLYVNIINFLEILLKKYFTAITYNCSKHMASNSGDNTG